MIKSNISMNACSEEGTVKILTTNLEQFMNAVVNSKKAVEKAVRMIVIAR
jgi:hypothetical protein